MSLKTVASAMQRALALSARACQAIQSDKPENYLAGETAFDATYRKFRREAP